MYEVQLRSISTGFVLPPLVQGLWEIAENQFPDHGLGPGLTRHDDSEPFAGLELRFRIVISKE